LTVDLEPEVEASTADVARRPGVTKGTLHRAGRIKVGFETVFVVVLGLGVLYPIYYLLKEGLSAIPSDWTKARALPDFNSALVNTVLLAVGSVVVALVLGVILAYATSVLPRKLGTISVVLGIVPLLIPPLAAAYGWIFVLSPDIGYLNELIRGVIGGDSGPFNAYTLWSIILVPTLYLVPYVYLFVFTALRTIDPNLRQAARSSGASWLTTEYRVVLPLLKPALWYSGTIVLLHMLGQFSMVLVFGQQRGINVLSTLMYTLTNSEPYDSQLAAFLGLPLLVIAIAFITLQSRRIGSFSLYAPISKLSRSATQTKRWPVLIVIVYFVISTVPPLAGLIVASLSPFWSRHVDVSTFGFDNFRTVLSSPLFTDGLKNSLILSTISTVLGLIICWLCAVTLVRSARRRTVVRALDYLVSLPLGIPPLLFGLAVFFSFEIGPFGWYGQIWPYIVAYTILILPIGTRILVSGFSQLDPNLERSARTSGAGVGRTLRHITVPMLRPTTAIAAMLMFILCVTEFSASSILATPNRKVLMTMLYSFNVSGSYPQIAAIALLMLLVSLVSSLVVYLVISGAGLRRVQAKFRHPLKVEGRYDG